MVVRGAHATSLPCRIWRRELVYCLPIIWVGLMQIFLPILNIFRLRLMHEVFKVLNMKKWLIVVILLSTMVFAVDAEEGFNEEKTGRVVSYCLDDPIVPAEVQTFQTIFRELSEAAVWVGSIYVQVFNSELREIRNKLRKKIGLAELAKPELEDDFWEMFGA